MYYMPDPVAAVKRAVELLKPTGRVVIFITGDNGLKRGESVDLHLSGVTANCEPLS